MKGTSFNTPPQVLKNDLETLVPLPLTKITEISPDTKIFRFALPEGHRLGLPVGLNVRTVAEIDGETVMRSYTPISSEDDLGFCDLLIKVYFPCERFPEGGKMTQYINKLKIGDTLDFVGPKGKLIYRRQGEFHIRESFLPSDKDFKIRKGIKKIGMIAGGSGITPMMQLVRDAVVKSNEDTELSLLFANRSEADILLREEIEETAKNFPGRFKFMFTIDSAEEDWKYKTGHINKDMIAESLPAAGDETMILICGPPPMIKFACLPNLAELGHKDENVFCY